jgi:hypothetical protein
MHDSSMELKSKRPDSKSISIFVRITPEMNAQLKTLAGRIRGGVATVMRQIVENALADGITVTGEVPRSKGARSKRTAGAGPAA